MVRGEPEFGHQMDAAGQETGSIAPKPSGGSISPLEGTRGLLLVLIAEQPDLTLDEIVAARRKGRIAGSRSAAWRFFERHHVNADAKHKLIRCYTVSDARKGNISANEPA